VGETKSVGDTNQNGRNKWRHAFELDNGINQQSADAQQNLGFAAMEAHGSFGVQYSSALV
jgi:hypothetical protein